jgi:hypothetical protein
MIPKMLKSLRKISEVHTSYRRDILLDILHRYTRFYNPSWATDEKIIAILDEQLPDLLPAPHNIEFFVRTSERLNSLEEVLRHVENSKEMIKALGEWMASLPDHEQLFLMWLEICSTTSILFPDTPASKMDFESTYMETLAYMFKRKYIAGIPTSPFSRAMDKFDMILLESRDKETESVKFDFVHPSYHEAFWYTIQRKLPSRMWWELLKENIDEILKDLKDKVDMVQLRMIERYGTINRDLDQLLLLSAESDDVNEQLIALEHMLERPDQFANLPQFSNCAHSIIESEDPKHRHDFLNLVDNCFDQLPLDVLNAVPPLLFYLDPDIRLKTEQIISKYFHTLPESVKQCETIRTWRIANDIFFSSEEFPSKRDYDMVSALIYSFSEKFPSIGRHILISHAMRLINHGFGREIREEWIDRFVNIRPADLQQLFKTEFTSLLIAIILCVQSSWDKLSSAQKEVIPIGDLLTSENDIIAEATTSLVLEHFEDLAHLAEKDPFIEGLKYLQKTFNITLGPGKDFISQLESIPIGDWTQISPDVLKTLINSTLSSLTEALIQKILENYDKLSKEQRGVFLSSKSSTKVVETIDSYIGRHKYDFSNLSDIALIDLLSFPGRSQYMALPGLLIRFGHLSKEAKLVINGLIENPSDWVGGAIGLLTSKRRFEIENKLSEDVRDLPIKLSRHHNKRVVGALLAEMASLKCDEFHGLQEMYEATLREILRDPEAVRYAEAWMDYELAVLRFYDEEYWSKAKTHLRNLSESD